MTEQAAIEIATCWMIAKTSDEVECIGANYCGPYFVYETMVTLNEEGSFKTSPDMLDYYRRELSPAKPSWLVNFLVYASTCLSVTSVKVDEETGEAEQEGEWINRAC
jgi:hypothetical protein